jgi:hypothetical protein
VVDLSRILYLERGNVTVVEPKKKWEGKSWKVSGKRGRTDQQGNKSQKKGRVEEMLECGKCGKKHGGDCREGTKACFRCGKEGHLASVHTNMICYSCGEKGHLSKECPKGAGAGKKAEPKTKARAYALTREEARDKPDVVSGTFLINNIHASVLFDSGATFSFISATACALWNLVVED